MIRLPNTGTYSLELITAQNGAQSVVSYSDATSSAYTGGTQVASITSATTTTICSTPAASTVRDVDQINVKNTFAGSHTVTVQVDANGTNYPLIVAALLTDESLNYTHGSGWCCLDANGNIKNSALTSMTSAQLAAIISDETGSGAAVFATSPTLDRVTVSTNSASAALTITQTGAGNALVVEDSASTDSTPFVVDASGNVGVGTTTPSVNIDVYHATSAIVTVEGESTAQYNAIRHSADATSARLNIRKTRGTKAVPTAVASGDSLGAVNMQGYGGTTNRDLVNIQGYVDTYTADNAITSYLTLSTSAGTPAAATERMRIASDGTTTLGGTSTAPALSVIPVASQTAWATVTASNGGNPKVGSNTNNLCLGTGSALATSATTGHVCIPSCAGAPTGVPVGAGAGQLPMIYDTTNNFLYIYNGGWKKSTVYA